MNLEAIKWELLKEENINKEDLDKVDLDIAFSPVMPFKDSKPMEVIKLENGKYRVPDCPMVGLNLSKEDIKIMRYRFLKNKPSVSLPITNNTEVLS